VETIPSKKTVHEIKLLVKKLEANISMLRYIDSSFGNCDPNRACGDGNGCCYGFGEPEVILEKIRRINAHLDSLSD
jgi:hypothetical protein